MQKYCKTVFRTFQSQFRFSESYERKKAEVYKAKTQDNFNVDPSVLVS